MKKTKGERQKARGKRLLTNDHKELRQVEKYYREFPDKGSFYSLWINFCLLPLAFYLLPFIFLASLSHGQESSTTAIKSEVSTRVDEVLKEISAIRELDIKQPIRKGFKSQSELRSFLLKKFDEEYSDEEIKNESKSVIKLGLLPKGVQLKELLINLLTEQIAGFYDPKEKTFYVSDWIPEGLQRPVMAHELTHALQDQYFNLEQFLKRIKDNDDRAIARVALVEGEAMVVMVEYLLKPEGFSFLTLVDLLSLIKNQIFILGEELGDEKIPAFIKEMLVFPYVQGMTFVQTLKQSYSWKDFSKIYDDPPASSEQILHPEKYYDLRDHPVSIEMETFSDLLPSNWKEIDTNVLGELITSVLMKKFAGEELAKIASEGWGGDRYKAFEDQKTENLLLLLFSTWDSPKDAMEFFLAYRQVVENKYTSEQLLQSEKRKNFHWSTPEGDIYLEVRGKDVIVLEGAPGDFLPFLKTRLWNSRKDR
jgi:hypothetical protein